jgi:NADPH:quinone reductase-like Zn-dependent oxidoreductase
LNDLASLNAGDTILIHAAAGGVGLFALQFARRIGARVIATASKDKRQYLHDMGVEHIFSSRDADEFRDDTTDINERLTDPRDFPIFLYKKEIKKI